MYGIFILHLRILNFGRDTLQHYKTRVPSSLLHRHYERKFKSLRELFKNTFAADRVQLRTEIERNIFSNTSECLLLTLQSVCGIVKLALISCKSITPKSNSCSSLIFVKKELRADTACFIARKSKRLIKLFYLWITFGN